MEEAKPNRGALKVQGREHHCQAPEQHRAKARTSPAKVDECCSLSLSCILLEKRNGKSFAEKEEEEEEEGQQADNGKFKVLVYDRYKLMEHEDTVGVGQ